MLERLRDMLRGARQLESIILIIILALIGLSLAGNSGGTTGASTTPTESRLREILSYIDGVEEAQVMITEDGAGCITGIVVVAAGVSDMRVRLNVQNAVSTLLDADLSQIEIINRGQEGNR